MAEAKELAQDVAKFVAKQATQKALMSAGTAVAPYVGIGCLIILGIYLLISISVAVAIILIYNTCNYSPWLIKFASAVSGILPQSLTVTKAASVLGPICDIFKDIK